MAVALARGDLSAFHTERGPAPALTTGGIGGSRGKAPVPYRCPLCQVPGPYFLAVEPAPRAVSKVAGRSSKLNFRLLGARTVLGGGGPTSGGVEVERAGDGNGGGDSGNDVSGNGGVNARGVGYPSMIELRAAVRTQLALAAAVSGLEEKREGQRGGGGTERAGNRAAAATSASAGERKGARTSRAEERAGGGEDRDGGRGSSGMTVPSSGDTSGGGGSNSRRSKNRSSNSKRNCRSSSSSSRSCSRAASERSSSGLLIRSENGCRTESEGGEETRAAGDDGSPRDSQGEETPSRFPGGEPSSSQRRRRRDKVRDRREGQYVATTMAGAENIVSHNALAGARRPPHGAAEDDGRKPYGSDACSERSHGHGGKNTRRRSSQKRARGAVQAEGGDKRRHERRSKGRGRHRVKDTSVPREGDRESTIFAGSGAGGRLPWEPGSMAAEDALSAIEAMLEKEKERLRMKTSEAKDHRRDEMAA